MNIRHRIAIGLLAGQLAGMAWAQQESATVEAPNNIWSLQISPYTYHFNYSEDHTNVYALGIEREHDGEWLAGLYVFQNSFGQTSAFLYPVGQVYKSIFGVKDLSFKWTFGLLYGYKEPYENKVPLNYNGFSPGLVLGLAYEFKPGWSAQLNLLGSAGLMLQFNVPLSGH